LKIKEMLKKNILYIVHSYHSFQKDSIEAISKEFENVYVIVRYKPIAEISKYLPIKSLNIHTKEHVIQKEGKPANVHIYTAPLWYIPNKFFYRLLGRYHFKVVERIIKKNRLKFDIIHSHFTWTSGYVGMRLKEKYKVPFVLNMHTSSTLQEQLGLKDEGVIGIWKSADAIIRVNEENIEDLEKYNKETYFIPNGFNKNLFFPRDQIESRRSLALDLDKKILLSVGHLDECKGHIFLIRAIGELVNSKNFKNIKLYLIGEGVLRSRLEKEIIDLGLEEYINIVGKKLHKEIPLWMNACDIFVLPSLSESFGIVQLEALACGKPVVATSTAGSRQLIKSEDIGLLCKVGDVLDLAEKLSLALNKEWSKSEIIEYSQNFSWENIIEQFLVIYKKVLKENHD
jgi:glycosyltransferase involved in cell wall biosynthesis